ncbi:hypothetical protein Syun_018765 [Stephania yunnanensis]|uniref:Uncharacterized protein n=1 Tax=Stephania yunnanensis TaxID=152371 RepID=A0AAP0NW42_9MAGN
MGQASQRSDVQPSETGMEHGGATSSFGDRDGLTPGGESTEGTELRHTPMDGVGSEDNAVDIEGANSPSTSSHAEDETTTLISWWPDHFRPLIIISLPFIARHLEEQGSRIP